MSYIKTLLIECNCPQQFTTFFQCQTKRHSPFAILFKTVKFLRVRKSLTNLDNQKKNMYWSKK